jgi:hypothetical protein
MQESPSNETEVMKQLLDGTEIVYVCTPNYLPILATSLQSLIASGSTFDRVSVYLTGKGSYQNLKVDDRIAIIESSPFMSGYPYADKLYLCRSRYRRVIFLDADTVILRPLETIYRGKNSDLLARFGSAQYLSAWNQEIWEANFRQLGLSDVVPMINTGLLIFQNGVHTKLMPYYADYIRPYLNDLLLPPQKGLSLVEQYALSLTVSKLGLKLSPLGSRSHTFGWQGESAARAVVFHTGGKYFKQYGRFCKSFPRDEDGKARLVRKLVHRQLKEARRRIASLENQITSLQREISTPLSTQVMRTLVRRSRKLVRMVISSAHPQRESH